MRLVLALCRSHFSTPVMTIVAYDTLALTKVAVRLCIDSVKCVRPFCGHCVKVLAREYFVPLLFAAYGCGSTAEGTLFKVTAALADSTCGSGAVNAKDDWTFQVRLKKDGSTLTWYDVESGTTTEGNVSDGKFSVSAVNNYVVTAGSDSSTGCTVRRHDNYSGDATLDSSSNLTKLEGDIVFKYSQATGYNCDSLIGTTDGFDDLPCEVDYTFVANPG
jgi:hypothetical protein